MEVCYKLRIQSATLVVTQLFLIGGDDYDGHKVSTKPHSNGNNNSGTRNGNFKDNDNINNNHEHHHNHHHTVKNNEMVSKIKMK